MFSTIEENTVHLLLEVHDLVALAHAMYLQQEVDARDANNGERVHLLLELHALIVHTITHVVHLQQEVQALTVVRFPREHLLRSPLSPSPTSMSGGTRGIVVVLAAGLTSFFSG